VTKVAAGGKEMDETLYLANDYLDEQTKRIPVYQGVVATIGGSCPCFTWNHNCPEPPDDFYPRICPQDQQPSATFSVKNHGTYTITGSCVSSSKSMNIAIEGIDLVASSVAAADELTKTYNVFHNNNFDQQLNPTTTTDGHATCYDVDCSDDDLEGDSPDEIGEITLQTETYQDDQAIVWFEAWTVDGSDPLASPMIKLYRNNTTKIEFGTEYLASDLPGTIKVEGAGSDSMRLRAWIKTQDNKTAKDEILIKVVSLDIEAVTPAPSSDQHEICHKDRLLIQVNYNNSDGDDNIDCGESDLEIPGGDPDLVKVTLHKPTTVESDVDGQIEVTFPPTLNKYYNQDKTGDTVKSLYDLSELPKDFYLEGKSISNEVMDTSIKVEMTLDSGIKCRDEIRFTVVNFDLDVDSDNNNGFDQPTPTANNAEDIIEDLTEDPATPGEALPGKYIMVNDDDNDNNNDGDGVVDYADGFDWDDSGGNNDDVNANEQFTPLILQWHPEWFPDSKIEFSYTASDPTGLTRSGTDPWYEYTPAAGKLRLWLKPGNVQRKKATAKTASASARGHYVEPGGYDVDWLDWQEGVNTKYIVLYAEAVGTSTSLSDLRIAVSVKPDGTDTVVKNDAVRVSNISVDADVDTNNNNGFNTPQLNLAEDHYENMKNTTQNEWPGKYIEINYDDDDEDSVPDFADGFDLENDPPGNTDNLSNNEEFTPITVEIKTPIDLTKALVKVTYTHSDPANVTRNGTNPLYSYSPPAGHLRLWTQPGNVARNKDNPKDNPAGNFVKPNTYEPAQLGFTAQDRDKSFYIERIKAQAQQISDDGQIKIEIDPDGSAGNAGWMAIDLVRTMIIKSDIDIDSDNNDLIADEDDPIEDKSPGAILPKDLAGDTPEGITPAYDYRKEIKLKVEPALQNSEISLTKSAGGIKIWTSDAGGAEVPLPATYNSATLPQSLWIDGTTKGAKVDITLEYKDQNALKVAEDEVRTLITETISWAPAKADISYVWSSHPNLGTDDGQMFEDQIDVQEFDTHWYEDTDDAQNVDFNDCTPANYRNMRNCGAFTVISHGGLGYHYAVYADGTVGVGDVACDTWRAGEANMTTVRFVSLGNFVHSVEVESGWLAANWSATLDTNKAIAIWSICYSAQGGGSIAAVKEAAGGRWRVGYWDPTDEVEAKSTNERLLKRMNGSWDAGQRRTTGEAWNAGGFSANTRMHGNDWTTLCPAPMRDDPVWPDANPGNRYGWGCIIFDTYMDDTIGANTALTCEGGGPTNDHRWGASTRKDGTGTAYGEYLLGFDFDKTSGTATTMKAEADNCKNKDPDGGREIDGNRIQPSKDDRTWPY